MSEQGGPIKASSGLRLCSSSVDPTSALRLIRQHVLPLQPSPPPPSPPLPPPPPPPPPLTSVVAAAFSDADNERDDDFYYLK